MIAVRKAQDRGHANPGWLDSWHSFSFANYSDPEHIGFGTLRVINEGRVAPGKGFTTHGHPDMEIISSVLEGALEHKDSMGNGSVIRPGAVRRMSAGTGVTHSAFNTSRNETAHFLQIWILPKSPGIRPGYEQNRVVQRRVASPDELDGSVTLHQDTFGSATSLEQGESVCHALDPERKGYLHLVRGKVTVNGHQLMPGDALKRDALTSIWRHWNRQKSWSSISGPYSPISQSDTRGTA